MHDVFRFKEYYILCCYDLCIKNRCIFREDSHLFIVRMKAVNGAKSFCSQNLLSNVRTKNHGSRLPPWSLRIDFYFHQSCIKYLLYKFTDS